jgi:hypothetical protein
VGTASGLRKGNVGGGADDEGACCLSVGIVRLGRWTVERNVDICRWLMKRIDLVVRVMIGEFVEEVDSVDPRFCCWLIR